MESPNIFVGFVSSVAYAMTYYHQRNIHVDCARDWVVPLPAHTAI
jgi:hypothetical protein